MKGQIVVHIEDVSKSFYARRTKNETIRDTLINLISSKQSGQLIKAVQNVSFKVEAGEVFGIIGSNGSGKSTLINLMMGSMRPDKGSLIKTKGRIMRLALGMGIDPNLSARDNVYINGSILGLSFRQIGERFDEILEFADLLKFVDVPVKNFSSGMRQRLTFSIAMHANADIFLLDEFFGGVGDVDFKEKSDKAFRQTIIDGKTIVIVSHSMGTIKKYCNRALWLDKGVPRIIGHPDEVIPLYKASFKK